MFGASVFAKKRTVQANNSCETAVISENSGATNGKIDFEMNIHVPCRCEGTQKNGSRWTGDSTTLSVSSFGANLLLPSDIDLEGDIELIFKVPPPLLALFSEKKFRVSARLKPSDISAPSSATMGKKVVRVAFAEPLYFESK